MAQKPQKTESELPLTVHADAPLSVEGMSYRDYAARPGLRAGYLAAIDRGAPGKAEWERQHPADTAAMRLGSALHCLILEPERFADEWSVGGPINERTGKPYGCETKAYLEWEAAQPKPVLPKELHAMLLGMADSIAAHPAARTIRDGPRKTELSLFWDWDGQPCKARLDCLQPGVIWDIKSCRDASYRGFERSIAEYRYHMQAAFYVLGAGLCCYNNPVKYYWLAVENSPPYALAVYQASIELLGVGHDHCEQAMARYAECKKVGNFPMSYADEIIQMAAPRWMLPDDEAIDVEE